MKRITLELLEVFKNYNIVDSTKVRDVVADINGYFDSEDNPHIINHCKVENNIYVSVQWKTYTNEKFVSVCIFNITENIVDNSLLTIWDYTINTSIPAGLFARINSD